MQKFESNQHSVNAASRSVIAFLSKPENLIQILPADRIENWRTTPSGCGFKIKGLADIDLELATVSDGEVIYRSTSDKPFSFDLVVQCAGDDQTTMSAYINADVNAFMGMMLKTPLSNFLDSLGAAITKKFSSI